MGGRPKQHTKRKRQDVSPAGKRIKREESPPTKQEPTSKSPRSMTFEELMHDLGDKVGGLLSIPSGGLNNSILGLQNYIKSLSDGFEIQDSEYKELVVAMEAQQKTIDATQQNEANLTKELHTLRSENAHQKEKID